ncbi:SSI family serine proteinase inhibitor [Streptomyces sp. NPDC052079]|uniref:SSI family serine proteinase inhibitor n=1 Tax=Streptomyces sp. NPDC052079 TaxID=3155526 RepID=UPI003441AE40
MTHTSVKAVRAALAAAVVLLACAAPARANSAGLAAQESWLMLSVSQGETTSASADGTMLRCDPPGGEHRRAADACAVLAAADGRIADVPSEDAVCPMVYAPVTAHAHGMWRDRPVTYTETFPNTCTLTARTGPIFDLPPQ